MRDSLRSTVATAQFFITGAFPGCDIPVHHQEKWALWTYLQSVITDDSAAFRQQAVQAMEKARSQRYILMRVINCLSR